MRIALVGDIHGNPLPLLQAIPHADAVIQLGDFAVLPSGAVVSTVPIYWIDGNHEWFHLFAQYQDAESPVEWAPNCFFVPRGAVLELGATRFLCMGGADSVDKVRQGAGWSPQVQITGKQICRALNVTGPIDAIRSHTPPQSTIQKHCTSAVLERAFKLSSWWTSPAACAMEVIWQHHGRPPLNCDHMHERIIDERGVRILGIGETIILDCESADA